MKSSSIFRSLTPSEMMGYAVVIGEESEIKTLYERYGNSSLYKAIMHDAISGDPTLPVIDYLLSLGVDTNYVEYGYQDTPLMKICEKGKIDIAASLIKAGALLNPKEGESLVLAITNGNLNMVKFLVEMGADVNIGDGRPIKRAILEEEIDIIKYLLDLKTDPNRLILSPTILLYAAETDNIEIVDLLLDSGVDINAADDDGDTALFVALDGQNIELCEHLLAKGASVNERVKGQLTSLQSLLNLFET